MDIEPAFTAVSASAAVLLSVFVMSFDLVALKISELVAESVTDRLIALVAVSVSEAVLLSVLDSVAAR